MKMIKYFFECCFNQSEGFEDLDRIINEFRVSEINEYQQQLIRELCYIIQTKQFNLASNIIKKYGGRKLDNLKEVEKFINFLYDKFLNNSTDVKAEDFEGKYKVVFCPVCTPDPEIAIKFSLIEKATVIDKDLLIYVCRPCKLVWLTEDIRVDNAQNYKKFMRMLGFKGLWKELKNIDYL